MNLKYHLAKLVEKHPYPWFIAWTLMHKLTFLLPHDKSYFALKHFGTHPTNNLLVDVGANTGISALSFRRLNSTTPIFSIEPNPLHKPSLEKLKQKLEKFDYLLKGVGDEIMEVTFYTPVYKGIVLHTFTSSSEPQVREAVKKSFGTRIAEQLIIKTSIAEIVRLDDLNLKPSIIKIDAEGYDYQVLQGGRNTIEMHRPFLMVEACHSEMEKFQNYFDSINYTILNYDYNANAFLRFEKKSLNYVSGGRNVFAVPNESLQSLPFVKDE